MVWSRLVRGRLTDYDSRINGREKSLRPSCDTGSLEQSIRGHGVVALWHCGRVMETFGVEEVRLKV